MEQARERDSYKQGNLDYDKVACQIDIQTFCYVPFYLYLMSFVPYLFLVLKTKQTQLNFCSLLKPTKS